MMSYFEIFLTLLRSYFWGWDQVQKHLGTYLCRQSTLVMEVQPYLLVFNSATFWAFFAFFLGPLGLFFCPLGLFLGSDLENIFGIY